MDVGVSIFFTDYSITAAELAVALEERGFDSVWAAEHSHIPASRKSSFILGTELPKRYYDVMDPFVTLTAAAMATKTLKVGTGVCLVAQRDPIQTAKLGHRVAVVSRPGGEIESHLLVRSVAFPDAPRTGYAVIVDLLVNDAIRQQLRNDTGVELKSVTAVLLILALASAAMGSELPSPPRPVEHDPGACRR